jgi:hypothetical protein
LVVGDSGNSYKDAKRGERVVEIKNLAEVLAGLNLTEKKVNDAARYAIGMAAASVERQAKKNANTGTHPRGQGHIPGTGPGPNVVTGNLRRSIFSRSKVGFGNSYVAEVGASMVYARAVEMGVPEWKSGVKYPYLVPAVESLKNSGNLNRTFTGAFAMYLRS